MPRPDAVTTPASAGASERLPTARRDDRSSTDPERVTVASVAPVVGRNHRRLWPIPRAYAGEIQGLAVANFVIHDLLL